MSTQGSNLEISSKIKKYVQNFNIFQSIPSATNPNELRSQIISTRLFIGMMILCLYVLLIYTSALTFTEVIIRPTPTLDLYNSLQVQYSQTLTCPCKETAIEHENMLRIDYTLHQVCSSVLVSEDWLDFLRSVRRWYDTVGYLVNFLNFHQKDLRLFSTLIFQGLRSLCKLAIEAIEYSIQQTYASQYTSQNLLSLTELQSQIQMIIDSLKSSTSTQLLLSMQMMRSITQINAIASTVQSNAAYLTTWSVRSFRFKSYDGCGCVRTAQCFENLSIYTGANVTYTIPRMYIGCYVLEALLRSSFDCFYNQSCFDDLISNMYPNATFHTIILDPLIPSRFNTNNTVQELFDQLMIEEWSWIPLYENYFNACQPVECRYTYESRSSIVYIFTTLFGMIGGLSTSLKIIVPRLVKIIRRRKTQNSVANDPATVNALDIEERPVERFTIKKQLNTIIVAIKKINLFPSIPPTEDSDELLSQILSTRLFIIMLITCLSVLLIYMSLQTVTKIIIEPLPTFHRYEFLYNQYSQTLACPCNQIAIEHDKLLRIDFKLHQVCSSGFVEEDWIDYVVAGNDRVNIQDLHFQFSGPFMFQALAYMCKMVHDSISFSIKQLYMTSFKSLNLITSAQLAVQTQTIVKNLESTNIVEFLSFLNAIREITQANNLLSVTGSNGAAVSNIRGNYLIDFKTYSNCSCMLNKDCTAPMRVVSNDQTSDFILPGMYVGCYILEALLQSNLDCFFNETCFNILIDHLNRDSPPTTTVLNASTNTRFSTDTSVRELLDRLMVEEWIWVTLYESYFNACQPVECTYSFTTRNDLVYIVTAFIGLVGGITTVLKLIIPRTIIFIRRKIRHKRSIDDSPRDLENRSMKEKFQQLMGMIGNLNIFPSVQSANDPLALRYQLFSTRLFLITFSLSLCILLLYTAAIQSLVMVVEPTPSLERYDILHMHYSQTLVCPCQQISIEHQQMIQIDYRLHQVCSSDFVNEKWLNHLYIIYDWWIEYASDILFRNGPAPRDFRSSSPFIFQTLTALCRLSNLRIQTSLTQFYIREYPSLHLISRASFRSQAVILMNDFEISVTRMFLSSMNAIADVIQVNNLLTAVDTNADLISGLFGYVSIYHKVYDGCSCLEKRSCASPSLINNTAYNGSIYRVPNFYHGCYAFDSLLQSSLSCFYDQACFDSLIFYLDRYLTSNITILNQTEPSRFSINTTVQGLFEKLMVEEWKLVPLYDNYFNACNPIECRYTYQRGNNAVQIIATLFGLCGGLISTLQFIIPKFIILLFHLIKKFRRAREIQVQLENEETLPPRLES